MKDVGVMFDVIIFVLLLLVCVYLGLVREGELFFFLMKDEYGIEFIMEYYVCMVNFYGRVGLIVKVYEIVVEEMEFEVGLIVWGVLMYVCFFYVNVEIGEIVVCKFFELELDNEYNFELLMRIYYSLGRLDDMERVRKMMID